MKVSMTSAEQRIEFNDIRAEDIKPVSNTCQFNKLSHRIAETGWPRIFGTKKKSPSDCLGFGACKSATVYSRPTNVFISIAMGRSKFSFNFARACLCAPNALWVDGAGTATRSCTCDCIARQRQRNDNNEKSKPTKLRIMRCTGSQPCLHAWA